MWCARMMMWLMWFFCFLGLAGASWKGEVAMGFFFLLLWWWLIAGMFVKTDAEKKTAKETELLDVQLAKAKKESDSLLQ